MVVLLFKSSKVNAATLTGGIMATLAHWSGVVNPIITTVGIAVTALLGITMIVLNIMNIIKQIREDKNKTE